MDTSKKDIFPSGFCKAKFRAYDKKPSPKPEAKKTPEWDSTGEGLLHLSGRDFLDIPPENAVLLDVRPDYEMSRLFDIENILYFPYPEIAEHINKLPKDRLIVVADAAGLRSRETALLLKDHGFTNIANLAGGIIDWDRQGLPVTRDRSRLLSGQCPCQLKTKSKSKKEN